MNKTPYRYILRFTIDPLNNPTQKLEALEEFCKSSLIDSVMLFVACEEINPGHLTEKELARWIPLLEKTRDRMEQLGVSFEINPWNLLAWDRDRILRDNQQFRRMVDCTGYEASAVACPEDEAFIAYTRDLYTRYAKVGPETMWIDDDLRLHNHSPLKWGGCFCDWHMNKYSQLAGKTLTREEFMEGILSSPDHPYRKIWLDCARDAILKLAGNMADAVFAVDPNIRIGLMTSVPEVHSAEGRDWSALMDCLTGNRRPCVRIHLPAYGEGLASEYAFAFPQVSKLTKAMLPADVTIMGELENYPYTFYMKSESFSRYQVETSTLLGGDAITLNIFDMMGNGVMDGERQAQWLREIKPFLEAVHQIPLDEECGVGVMFDPRSAYTLHAYPGDDPSALYPRESALSGVLTAFSIANHYCDDRTVSGKILAISGQYLRNLSNEEIRRLFDQNRVIIDGETVEVLLEKGLGTLAGIRKAPVCDYPKGLQAFEETVPGTTYYGLERARISVHSAPWMDVLDMDYADDVTVIARLHNPCGKAIANTIACFGDRVLILPYRNYQHFYSHLTPVFVDILQRFVGGSAAYIPGKPYMMVSEFRSNNKPVFAIINSSNDTYNEFDLNTDRLGETVKVYSRTCPEGFTVSASRTATGLHFDLSLGRLETIWITGAETSLLTTSKAT